MLSVTGLNHFYYVLDFTDVHCKYSRVLSIIRERLHREPSNGDVFIVMLRNRRIVRMFPFDNRSYSLSEKKFVAGYQFMKVDRTVLAEERFEMVHYAEPGKKPEWGYFSSEGHPEVVTKFEGTKAIECLRLYFVLE